MEQLKGENLRVQRLRSACLEAWKRLEEHNQLALQKQLEGTAGPGQPNEDLPGQAESPGMKTGPRGAKGQAASPALAKGKSKYAALQNGRPKSAVVRRPNKNRLAERRNDLKEQKAALKRDQSLLGRQTGA